MTEQGPPLRVQDVVDRLVDLEMPEDEAQVYVHLSRLGPSKASKIATASGLNRPKTYRTLDSLVRNGFVAETLDRPTRFVAAAPEEVFDRLLAHQRARAQSLREARDELTPALLALRGHAGGDRSTYAFRTIHGRREIYALMAQMVRRATSSIETVTTHAAALRLSQAAGLLDLSLERAREGVHIRGVLLDVEAVREALHRVPAVKTLELRVLETDRAMRFVAADGSELLVWLVSDPSQRLSSEEDVAIWTDARDFVDTHLALFDALWDRAVPVVP